MKARGGEIRRKRKRVKEASALTKKKKNPYSALSVSSARRVAGGWASKKREKVAVVGKYASAGFHNSEED